MPTNIKIVVSILIIALGFTLSYFENQAGAGLIKWFIGGLGVFMAFSLWIFPEPKMKTGRKDT